MIKAEVIADSKNEFNHRITTMIVTMPRYILAEFNTHRMFSRNSASSRAIPFDKMVKSIEDNPFIPMAWQIDHSGMQGTKYITDEEHLKIIKEDWLNACDEAIHFACRLQNKRVDDSIIPPVTKQLVNRLLEPFMYHTVIVTATEWENFFALRCPQYTSINNKQYRSWKDLIEDKRKDAPLDWIESVKNYSTLDKLMCNKGQADIHMMAVAEAMWDAYNESKPKELKAGEWHIPFGDNFNDELLSKEITKEMNKGNKEIGKFIDHIKPTNDIKIKIATARCARVSYTVFGEEKSDNYEADIKLYDKLLASGHLSPFEHCGKAMTESELWYNTKQQGKGTADLEANKGWSGNFKGFIQLRKTLLNENRI